MGNKILKAVLFDMDGVIADTMKFHFLANKRIATELGIEFEGKDNDKFKGISRMDIIKTFVKQAGLNLSQEELEELSERKNRYYKEYMNSLNENDVLDGILHFLKELKAAGLKTAVASSSTNALTVLTKLKVVDYFDYIVDAKTLKKGKPDPEVFLKASDALGVEYKNCIALEDGEAGLQAILNTPMFSVGIGEDKYMVNAHHHILTTSQLNLKELKKLFRENDGYVIGVDGGGTYTRATLADVSGKIISSVKIEGGAHPGKNKNAKENVQSAIQNVVKSSHLSLDDISILVCGIAGINNQYDLEWAQEFVEIEGLNCEKLLFNDAVIARKGAFENGVGIIAIAGTGSIVMGFKEDNSVVRNYDFNHLAYAGARYISNDAIHGILAGNTDDSDSKLIKEVLEYWKVESISELRNLVIRRFFHQTEEITRKISSMTILITTAAEEGSVLAQNVCYKAAFNLATGIKLVASNFNTKEVDVAIIGGVVNDSFFKKSLINYLSSSETHYNLNQPLYEPSYGAVLLGLEKLNRQTQGLK